MSVYDAIAAVKEASEQVEASTEAEDMDPVFEARDGMQGAALGLVQAVETLVTEVQGSQPIPGIRPYRLATVDELLDAWSEFDSNFESLDVSAFITAWNDYTEGKDFPCPEAKDGLHYVTDGSCNYCGDKNREDTPE